MEYHNLEVKEALKKLETNENGLTSKEAHERLIKDGKNILVEEKKKSYLKMFLAEFLDLMIIILIISAIISFILALINHESFMDSIIIILIVIMNALFGFFQELKADKALSSLKKMQTSKVKVKRDGKVAAINSEDIVRGDIILLEAGDFVPADARIIYQAALKVDESSLTGESVNVYKNVAALPKDTYLAERTNMVYAGSTITYGKASAVVCEVGAKTEFGKIAAHLAIEEKEVTPLQVKLEKIGKILAEAIGVIVLIVFVVGLVKGMPLKDIFMLSISLAVAAIPEGLPAVITIVLSLGVSTLAKKKAIVRKLESVETLGCTEIICSDKTGTITMNKMKVQEMYFNDTLINDSDDMLLVKSMILNNDAEKNKNEYIGDPTEIALSEYWDKKINIETVQKENPRVGEIPFDSERKLMSTINQDKEQITLYTKGSFDALIEKCAYIYLNGKVSKLTKQKKEELKNIEIQESDKAYRVLAYAYKVLDKDYVADVKLENDLIFVGLSSLSDEPRKEVKKAIEYCKIAHIKPVMITGDSLKTATAIARKVGILENDNEAVLGSQLDKMSDKELKEKVNNYSVYARVSPSNKVAIVKAWQANNKVVAMTGDGVNDAPALKKANIGIGMGITGSDVAKGASDLILMDDSFATIVVAVKEGRRIFDNIRKVLVYLLTANIAEVLVVFICILAGQDIFLPMQLLYINLITDSMPAIALTFEAEEQNILKREIRKKDSSFFTPFLVVKMALSSTLKAIGILLIYFVNLKTLGVDVARTMAFLTLILLELVFAYNCKNLKQSVINKGFFNNKTLNKCTLLLILVQIIFLGTPLRVFLKLVPLNLMQVMFCILITLLVFFIDEVSKKIISSYFKD